MCAQAFPMQGLKHDRLGWAAPSLDLDGVRPKPLLDFGPTPDVRWRRVGYAELITTQRRNCKCEK